MLDQSTGHVIERRAYGPESSPAEIEAIRARLYVYRDNIIMYREMPVQTTFQLGLYDTRLGELAVELGNHFSLLVDLTEASPPNAETRALLKAMFARHCQDKVAAVFTGKNFLLNVAARFVLGSIFGAGHLKSFSIHKTLEEAVDALAPG